MIGVVSACIGFNLIYVLKYGIRQVCLIIVKNYKISKFKYSKWKQQKIKKHPDENSQRVEREVEPWILEASRNHR